MEDLSLVTHLDHDMTTWSDRVEAVRTGGPGPARQPAYRVESLIESLSAYDAVFACSAATRRG